MEGEIQVNEMLKKDITIRIVSIIFAVILWFFALGSVNPISTVHINIPLKIQNENLLAERGMGIKDKNIPAEITITVSGRKKQIAGITSKDFEASIDFADVKDEGAKEIPINLKKLKDGIRVKNMDSLSLKVQIEKIQAGLFNVDVKTEGNLRSGYIVIGKSASPDAISLSGLESTVNSVASVTAILDINNVDRDLVIRKDCSVLNAKGEEISEFSGKYNVDVKLQVAKEVSLVPVINNETLAGSVVKTKTINPQKVYITGSPDVLSQINELYTQSVDVANINNATSIKSQIVVPKGISLYNSPSEAEVSVIVEKAESKEITIDKSKISIKSNNNNTNKIEITTPSTIVKLKGLASNLNQIDALSLAPIIDVTDLGEGAHTVPLSVTLPDNVSLQENSYVDIKITRTEDANNGSSPANTADQTPTPGKITGKQ